ncbi:DUF4123 domain-containing protein [Pseudoduganella sp. R-32]|uniref:DUF4123 domain-containing protein n=1 Tax=Pseudoduganella sp. R-32 TaxID=3404061 RepID=UPI003CF572DB
MSFPSPNIATSFHTHLEEYGHCDIVIDRMRGFPLREELKALKGHLAESLPLIDPLFMTIPDEAPLLVRLSVDASSLIESYLALAAEEAQRPGQGQAICAFLFSHLPCEKLAGHLTRQLDLRIKTGKRVFFRFFDPRVMHHLPRLLQPAEMAQLLNGRLLDLPALERPAHCAQGARLRPPARQTCLCSHEPQQRPIGIPARDRNLQPRIAHAMAGGICTG